MGKGLPEIIAEIDRSARERYMAGDAAELTLRGHHPGFLVEERGDTLEFNQLLSDSINLIGSHLVRNMVCIGDDPVVIYDGSGYYAKEIFGSFISTRSLTLISHQLALPYSFS